MLSANVIKGLIIQNGSSRNAIAQQCSVSGPLVSMVISGDRHNKTVRDAICKIIGLPYDKVWASSDSPKAATPKPVRRQAQSYKRHTTKAARS